MAAFKVNFSEQEVSSEARSFEPLPTGEYHCKITDIDERECGPNSKNPGKPFWAIEFTVQDGPYEMRKVWTNAMLFEGALYTVSQLLKATGNEKALQTGEIPDAESFISKDVVVVVKKQRDTYAMERDGDGEVQWKNEVRGIKKWDGQPSKGKTPVSGAAKGKSGSLLP